MNDLIKLYRDPGVAEPTGSPMLDAMNEAEAAAPIEKVDTPAPETEEKPKSKFAWGEEDRRKPAPVDEDPEFDLGYEDEKDGVKTPAKMKQSEIRARAKWLKENDGLIRGAVSMREEFKKNPELSKVFNTFWGKAYEGDKYNPEAVAKFSAMLEAKAEATVAKAEDNADDIVEAEKELAELDQDSPQYKIAKRSLNALKAVRTQLAEERANNKTTQTALQAKLDGLDKFKGDFETTQKTQKEEADAKQSGDLFDTTFGALASGESMKFDDADDAKELESSVRDMVATLANPNQEGGSKIKNDADFTKAIQESAKTAHERISKRNQRIVTEYLKKKGQLPPEKEKPKEKEKEKSSDDESIGDAIIREMSAAK